MSNIIVASIVDLAFEKLKAKFELEKIEIYQNHFLDYDKEVFDKKYQSFRRYGPMNIFEERYEQRFECVEVRWKYKTANFGVLLEPKVQKFESKFSVHYQLDTEAMMNELVTHIIDSIKQFNDHDYKTRVY